MAVWRISRSVHSNGRTRAELIHLSAPTLSVIFNVREKRTSRTKIMSSQDWRRCYKEGAWPYIKPQRICCYSQANHKSHLKRNALKREKHVCCQRFCTHRLQCYHYSTILHALLHYFRFSEIQKACRTESPPNFSPLLCISLGFFSELAKFAEVRHIVCNLHAFSMNIRYVQRIC